MAQDAIPLHEHPQPRAMAVIFHAPRRIVDLLDVVRGHYQLSSAMLDIAGLPRIRGFEALPHAYLSVPAEYAEHLDRLNKAWVAGKRIRVFRLHDAKSLFVFPARLMDALHAMAQRAVHDDAAGARPVAVHQTIDPFRSGSRSGSRNRSGNGVSRPRLAPRSMPVPAPFVSPPPGVDPAALIPFDAHLVGGTMRDLARLPIWRSRFGETFARRLSCHPQHIEVDDVNDRVRFWMPRRPGMVYDVMRESGVTIAGIWLEFSPADVRDAIPEHESPPPRTVLVLFRVPHRARLLLAALGSMHVRTDLLDCFALPPMPAFPKLSYGFLTVYDVFADMAAGIDKTWVEGTQMRAFRLQNARALFADRDRLMEEVQAMARTVVAEESGQHYVPPTRE
ncbi:hypothetical protein GGF32_005031 [Allomyces javanicus]|nr:hypothetical protein GGF32_005031 [Allomyces javanicus]